MPVCFALLKIPSVSKAAHNKPHSCGLCVLPPDSSQNWLAYKTFFFSLNCMVVLGFLEGNERKANSHDLFPSTEFLILLNILYSTSVAAQWAFVHFLIWREICCRRLQRVIAAQFKSLNYLFLKYLACVYGKCTCLVSSLLELLWTRSHLLGSIKCSLWLFSHKCWMSLAMIVCMGCKLSVFVVG